MLGSLISASVGCLCGIWMWAEERYPNDGASNFLAALLLSALFVASGAGIQALVEAIRG